MGRTGTRRGKRSWGRGPILAVCLVAWATIPATALAAQQPSERTRQTESFSLPAADGYTLTVQASGRSTSVVLSDAGPPIATASADGTIVPPYRGPNSTVQYELATPRTDRRRIVADLGALGKIDVAFVPSGNNRVTVVYREKPKRRCTARTRFVRRTGTWRGTISFKGENGYTSAEAISAPGSVGDFPDTNCYPIILNRPPVPTVDAFEVGSFAVGDPAISFSATGGRRPASEAATAERIDDSLTIFRSVSVIGGKRTFALGRDRVTVNPPAPFAGSATLTNIGAGPPRTWEGALSVTFPDGASAQLTGPTFRTRFYEPD